MKPIARRNARHYAIQALYQWTLSGTPASEIEKQFIANQIKKEVDIDYFKETLHAISENTQDIDQHFIPFLTRPVYELDPIELSILRLATYEFIHRLDVPYRVIINEALDLAKRFGSVEGYKFVNGVLDQVARSQRKLEVAQDTKK
jgi:transcription antitermination protein NusB